jgi:hypothetical protein
MSIGSALGSATLPAEAQADQGNVRAEQALTFPPSGSESTGESKQSQKAPDLTPAPQDEVKVQVEPPGEIPVYQFVNQQGELVLQVPPQPVINLALAISQEQAQEAAPKGPAGSEGGENNGR